MSGNISIDQELVRSLVAKGIIDSLGQDQQLLIMEQAVEGLLREDERYGKAVPGTSPLALGFQRQVNAVAEEVIKDYLATPQMRQRIIDAVHSAVDKLLSQDLSWLDAAIAHGVTEKIRMVVKENWEN